MADVERFVHTEVASAGGDGTTRDKDSVASTRPYLGVAAWNSAEAADIVTATDTHRVRCAGATADTAALTVAGWTTDASFFVTVEGDDGADTGTFGAYNNDGAYAGSLVWSTGHYRIEDSADFESLDVAEAFTQILRFQVENTRASGASHGIRIIDNDVLIDGVRVTLGGTAGRGIGAQSGNDDQFNLFNSIVFDCNGDGVASRAGGAIALTYKIYNNTIFDCVTGLDLETDDADLTFIFKNNVFYNNTTNIISPPTNATWTHSHNALDDGIYESETGGVDMTSTVTDDMVDPENATMKSRDVTPKSTGALFEAGIGSGSDSDVPLLDILGTTRNTTNPSIGAIETLAAAGANPHNPLGHPIRGPLGGPVG